MYVSRAANPLVGSPSVSARTPGTSPPASVHSTVPSLLNAVQTMRGALRSWGSCSHSRIEGNVKVVPEDIPHGLCVIMVRAVTSILIFYLNHEQWSALCDL